MKLFRAFIFILAILVVGCVWLVTGVDYDELPDDGYGDYWG